MSLVKTCITTCILLMNRVYGKLGAGTTVGDVAEARVMAECAAELLSEVRDNMHALGEGMRGVQLAPDQNTHSSAYLSRLPCPIGVVDEGEDAGLTLTFRTKSAHRDAFARLLSHATGVSFCESVQPSPIYKRDVDRAHAEWASGYLSRNVLQVPGVPQEAVAKVLATYVSTLDTLAAKL